MNPIEEKLRNDPRRWDEEAADEIARLEKELDRVRWQNLTLMERDGLRAATLKRLTEASETLLDQLDRQLVYPDLMDNLRSAVSEARKPCPS